MTTHTCPRCGGSGGVLLLDMVAPCDPCHEQGRLTDAWPNSPKKGRSWVRFGPSQPRRVPEADCIGWNGYTIYKSNGDRARELADRHFARLPDPDGSLVPKDNNTGYRVDGTIDGGIILYDGWDDHECEGWYLAGEP